MKTIVLAIICALMVSFNLNAAQNEQSLTVFAASSLTDAFTEIAEAFATEFPDAEIIFNFASSSTLATQLAEGAPADVFASANERQMEIAIESGRIQEPAEIFARNRLVIAIPADNPAEIEGLIDLAQPGLALILVAPDTPIRDYTDTMLEQLAADPNYGNVFREAVLANLVSEEANVRQAVSKIVLGEADATIVYQSDVTPDISEQVTAIPVPDEYNVIAGYPIAITADSANADLAQSFMDYVLSDDGQAVLMNWNLLGKCPEQLLIEETPEAEPSATATPEPGCEA